MKAMTAKLERETNLYDNTTRFSGQRNGQTNPPYNGTNHPGGAPYSPPGYPSYNYVAHPSDAPYPYPVNTVPASPIGNQPAYPMSYPVPYSMTQDKSYDQQPGYVQDAGSSVFTESNRTETDIKHLSPNTAPHTPDPSIPQPPHST